MQDIVTEDVEVDKTSEVSDVPWLGTRPERRRAYKQYIKECKKMLKNNKRIENVVKR